MTSPLPQQHGEIIKKRKQARGTTAAEQVQKA